MTTDPAVELRSVTRTYRLGTHSVTALDAVSLVVPAGTFTAVMGPSGSGKSTLMHCAAGLDRPDGGTVVLAGTDLSGLDEKRLTRLRRDRVGFVFQAFNLVSALTAAQNVALPLRLAHRAPSAREVLAALDAVGLAARARHRPAELSGGEQQRVAVARALITRPAVLFADEPTGALDTVSSRDLLERLRGLVDDHGQTVITVTHDPVVAAVADRVVFLADGRVVDTLDRSDRPVDAELVAARMAHLEV
ncbi:MAG TPA: ABC transporter ATP-binding protein [Pseudonocardiaceae bacterium]